MSGKVTRFSLRATVWPGIHVDRDGEKRKRYSIVMSASDGVQNLEQRAWWLSLPENGLPRHDRFGGTFEDEIRAWEGKHG